MQEHRTDPMRTSGHLTLLVLGRVAIKPFGSIFDRLRLRGITTSQSHTLVLFTQNEQSSLVPLSSFQGALRARPSALRDRVFIPPGLRSQAKVSPLSRGCSRCLLGFPGWPCAVDSLALIEFWLSPLLRPGFPRSTCFRSLWCLTPLRVPVTAEALDLRTSMSAGKRNLQKDEDCLQLAT